MRRILVLVVLVLGFGVAAGSAQAGAGRGEGGIVIREGAEVYPSARSTEAAWRLKRGDAVAGTTIDMGFYQPLFDEKGGRVHVTYFRGEQKGVDRNGWMRAVDLARFYFDGGCSPSGNALTAKGFSTRWNACFREALDLKLKELASQWTAEAKP